METYAPIAFGFGNPAEWIIIMVVALIVFGPAKLPELGRQVGQAMKEFNKLRDELTGVAHSVRDEVESAYTPVVTPYSAPHTTSSPTVETASTSRVYDQDPEDLMAPVVPEMAHTETDGRLLVPPPATAAAAEASEKGH